MATDGTLIVEGPVIDTARDSFAAFFYHHPFADDVSNWWIPTLRCLRKWIECSYFELVSEAKRPALSRSTRRQRLIEPVTGPCRTLRWRLFGRKPALCVDA